MTQTISVYISKTISGPNILHLIESFELGTTEVSDSCETNIWNKATTTQNI